MGNFFPSLPYLSFPSIFPFSPFFPPPRSCPEIQLLRNLEGSLLTAPAVGGGATFVATRHQTCFLGSKYNKNALYLEPRERVCGCNYHLITVSLKSINLSKCDYFCHIVLCSRLLNSTCFTFTFYIARCFTHPKHHPPLVTASCTKRRPKRFWIIRYDAFLQTLRDIRLALTLSGSTSATPTYIQVVFVQCLSALTGYTVAVTLVSFFLIWSNTELLLRLYDIDTLLSR